MELEEALQEEALQKVALPEEALQEVAFPEEALQEVALPEEALQEEDPQEEDNHPKWHNQYPNNPGHAMNRYEERKSKNSKEIVQMPRNS